MNEERRIKDMFACNYISPSGEVYPLQGWYNQLIDKKVSEINVADVIRMIRQNEFLDLALSKAILFLKDNPFAGEMYEGELLEKVSNIETNVLQDYLDDIKNILLRALTENETYEWLLESERKAFKELIENFSKRLDDLKFI